MQPWNRIEPTVITKIDYQNVVVKTFELPDKKFVTRAIFGNEGTRAAGVIAITRDKKVVVTRQFRPGPEKLMDELPGGFVDKDEEPEAAALRELLEETGYIPGAMKFIGSFHRDAYLSGEWFYYLATDCVLTSEQALEHDEFIEVRLISIKEFIENAKHNGMTDTSAVLAAYEDLSALSKE
ncbi:MAG TPA: NUDIX hydrolase, partial [Candidatus Saccharimonadales bacterium]|nr:NUDIX hydrolase [Candidatus Saccharimonadales bacterium]